jgi:hypothetical protein
VQSRAIVAAVYLIFVAIHFHRNAQGFTFDKECLASTASVSSLANHFSHRAQRQSDAGNETSSPGRQTREGELLDPIHACKRAFGI